MTARQLCASLWRELTDEDAVQNGPEGAAGLIRNGRVEDVIALKLHCGIAGSRVAARSCRNGRGAVLTDGLTIANERHYVRDKD